ncbi:MAG TPA: carotenoid biosynthesis protein [Polyangiaceae bacterium]|nr:carotenoid biosynthesis protein [Polyangiaceae bacterium]
MASSSSSVASYPHRSLRITVALLAILYGVGTWGMLSVHRPRFIALSCVNLLFTAGLLLWNARRFTSRGALAFALAAVGGFLIEWLGVSTGWPFGAYTYTDHLGPRWYGVPFVIGLNWAVLTHATQASLTQALDAPSVANQKHGSIGPWLRSALGATLMTAFDGLMEPAAIALRFWVWNGGHVPTANYAAWWVISFILLRLGLALNPGLRNPAAPWVLGIQALFFGFVGIEAMIANPP